MNPISFLDLKAQYHNIKSEIDFAISEVINNSAFIGGKFVKEFENNFAEFQNVKYCVGVGNGTDALEIAIQALDLPENSEIVVPANSFIATSEAVTKAGHKVIFGDCRPDNHTLNAEELSKVITPNTAAIIPVHLFGHPCDMDEIIKIATEHNLKIIEDCAQAHGAEYNNRKVGNFGNISTFSFYPGKNLGAYGDGGAIVTNNEALATKSRMIANHGRLSKYNHEFEGRNSRLDGLQAAILNVKLKHLDSWTESRRSLAERYSKKISGIVDISIIKESTAVKAVYHLFVIETTKRNDLQNFLKESNISSGIHYPVPLPMLPAYSYLGKSEHDFPVACTKAKRILSLPLFPEMTVEQQDYVIQSIKQFSHGGTEFTEKK